MSSNPFDGRVCMTERMAIAVRYIATGEWTAGHDIARRALNCARTGGCGERSHCACAAESLIGRLRTTLAA
ncbi:MAG: hypothetical protein ACM31L_18695 [Actinomycetota bacterium]